MPAKIKNKYEEMRRKKKYHTGCNSDQSQREAQALVVQKLDSTVHWINRMVGEMVQNSETSHDNVPSSTVNRQKCYFISRTPFL